MAKANYILSHLAYVKMILHVAKHPGQVNGVLLGTVEEDGNVLVSDTIPLLHHWTSLSPMMEIGLDLAKSNAEERHLKLVGYYQATDRPTDERVLYPVGEKVASIVREGFENACALVIDSNSVREGAPSVIPFLPSPSSSPSSSQWTRLPPISFASPSSQFRLATPDATPAAVQKVIHDGQSLQEQFGDFDDHLEDVSVDWLRNEGVGYLL